jgi:transposase
MGTLRDAVLRYNAEGLAGLYNRPSPGRTQKLDAEQKMALKELVLKGPDIEVEGISAYTLEDLAAIAKDKWGVSYHRASISRVVRKLGGHCGSPHPRGDRPACEERCQVQSQVLGWLGHSKSGNGSILRLIDRRSG